MCGASCLIHHLFLSQIPALLSVDFKPPKSGCFNPLGNRYTDPIDSGVNMPNLRPNFCQLDLNFLNNLRIIEIYGLIYKES